MPKKGDRDIYEMTIGVGKDHTAKTWIERKAVAHRMDITSHNMLQQETTVLKNGLQP